MTPQQQLLNALRFLLADYLAIDGPALTGSEVPADRARAAIAIAQQPIEMPASHEYIHEFMSMEHCAGIINRAHAKNTDRDGQAAARRQVALSFEEGDAR